MKNVLNNERGFLSLVSILFTLVIVGIVAYYAMNTYWANQGIEREDQEYIAKEGIDMSSQVTVLDSTREKIQGIEQQMKDREDQLWGDY